MSYYSYNKQDFNSVSKEIVQKPYKGYYPVDPIHELEYYKNPNVSTGKVNPFPAMLPNGGMYRGEPCGDRAHIPKPVVHTGTYFHQVLLKSANPPPGAQEQYIGTNRSGNNYVVMPGIQWYNPEMTGPYEMKTTK